MRLVGLKMRGSEAKTLVRMVSVSSTLQLVPRTRVALAVAYSLQYLLSNHMNTCKTCKVHSPSYPSSANLDNILLFVSL